MITAMGMFADRLKKLREDRKISQRTLARETGLSPAIISRYESGERTPTEDVIYKIARYFNVSADYLLGLTDDPRPKSGKFDPMEYLPRSVKDMITKTPEELRTIGKRLIEIADELEGKGELK